MLVRGALVFAMVSTLFLLGCAAPKATQTKGPATTIRCIIKSQPPGADIYWGPSSDKLQKSGYKTPYVVPNKTYNPIWKAWYYQVRKDSYRDSVVILSPQSWGDRYVDFSLAPVETSAKYNP